jgi:hypothetical protein
MKRAKRPWIDQSIVARGFAAFVAANHAREG